MLAVSLAILPFSRVQGKNGDEKAVYIFGYGQSFRDSMVYLAPIAILPNSAIDPKTKFLRDRDGYSAQMKQHVESTGTAHATCMVFFFSKKKQAEKKYAKLRKQIQRDPQKRLTEIARENFFFSFIETSTQE